MLKNSPAFWAEAWSRHFASYTKKWGRQAYYLHFNLRANEARLLELGAGSFRDTVRLNRLGYDCTGVDFSPAAVESAKRTYPALADKILQMDATNLQFPDSSFDVTYHNGFLAVFDDDDVVNQVLREQTRVSRSRIVCTVQNASHTQQVEEFARLCETDGLYDIRFWEPEEIYEIMRPYCRDIVLLPFGHYILDRVIRYAPFAVPVKHCYKYFCSETIHAGNVRETRRIMAIGSL